MLNLEKEIELAKVKKIEIGKRAVYNLKKYEDKFKHIPWRGLKQGDKDVKLYDALMEERICHKKIQQTSQWPFYIENFEQYLKAVEDFPENIENYMRNRLRSTWISAIDETRFAWYENYVKINPKKNDNKFDFILTKTSIEMDLKSTNLLKEDEKIIEKGFVTQKDCEKIIQDFYSKQGSERYKINNRIFLIRPRNNISFILDKELNRKALDMFFENYQTRTITVLNEKTNEKEQVYANLIIITENKDIFTY